MMSDVAADNLGGGAEAQRRPGARGDHRLVLPDGRTLGYAIFGDPGGHPVIYSHGFPGSRCEAALLDTAARRAKVAIIAPDRPGIGLSDFQPGRRIADWADDVECLVEALGVPRLSLLGGSGGSPFALACVARLRGRLYRVGLAAGLAPPVDPALVRRMSRTARLAFGLARRAPPMFDAIFGALGAAVARYPQLMFVLNDATPPDRAVLGEPQVRAILEDSVREAFRGGTRGPLHELRLLGSAWGFDLAAIEAEVSVWHGLDDGVVPPQMARTLAGGIPGARLHLIPGEGHVSLSAHHAERFLRELAPEPA